MGAGILPVCLYRHNLWFLFGKERSTGLWSDFGGASELGETDIETAIREGGEETNGFLDTDKNLYEKVMKYFISSIYYDKYTSYLFRISYDKNLPTYFKNNNLFMEKHLSKQVQNKRNGLFEKSEIRWFSYNDIQKEKHFFRPWYRSIINAIIQDYNNLLINAKKT